ncbi:MAG TPA: PAS domain S-box protein [Cyclobacteriaceae bacterium]|nr:PAS domain S-box protein [Cyclobacteriaceae bacterium]
MKDKQPYSILLIEDNPGDATLVEEYLNEQIHSVEIKHVTTFEQARKILEKTQCPFDVVLLDLTLPDKSGESLITDIISLIKKTPVIVLTGYAEFSFGVKSLSLGASDYLLKDDLSASTLYKSIRYNIERKKMISELIESEKKYSDLFHLSPQPLWVYSLDTLKFLDVNQAAIDHYGYSKDEFLKMTIKDIRPPEDIPELEAAIQKVSESKEGEVINSGAFRHKKKNGEIIKVEIQGNLILYKGKKAELVLAHDVTERYRYISAIESQNKKLRDIAWQQSHVVRAPVARIMGLINLIDKLEGADINQKELFDLIIKSAHEIDSVIKEITERAEDDSHELFRNE